MNAETKVMRFPAGHEGNRPSRVETPNTSVIGKVVKLVAVPYTGNEPAPETITQKPMSDYVELPVDV